MPCSQEVVRSIESPLTKGGSTVVSSLVVSTVFYCSTKPLTNDGGLRGMVFNCRGFTIGGLALI